MTVASLSKALSRSPISTPRRRSPTGCVGLGVNAPFGLKLEYDDGFFGRYDSRSTDLKTYNIWPSAAFKLNDNFSIGSVDVQYLEGEPDPARCRGVAAGLHRQLPRLRAMPFGPSAGTPACSTPTAPPMSASTIGRASTTSSRAPDHFRSGDAAQPIIRVSAVDFNYADYHHS